MLVHRKNRTAPPPEACPLSTCVALLSGAWTPNIIWYLRDGPRRFNELRSDIGAVSAKVLTAKLRKMERDGILIRSVRSTSPPSVEYALTALGQELRPAIETIVAVGHKLKAIRSTQVRSS